MEIKPDFNKIAQRANIDLAEFEKRLNEFLHSDDSQFNDYIKYIFTPKGKRIRPFLVYLGATMFGEINQRTHKSAVIIELLHNATLVHDDIVDEALVRRGQPSLNNAEGNKKAVLTGDYILAKALQLAVESNEYEIIKMMIPVICDMSEGELQQLKEAELLIDEKNYYEIIFKKTASLIALCLKIGAITANADKNQVEIIGKIGEKIGYIFQIKDDILDFVGNEKTGKERGNDIKENKITLPLICAWQNMSADERKTLTEIWNCERNNENIGKIIEIVIFKNGISDAQKAMLSLRNEIETELKTLNGKHGKFIQYITDYIIEREK